jgi:hypothetical protein
MARKALTDGTVQEEVGLRYVRLFSQPRPSEELRSAIDELVAGDHITYHTSWGTLLGRDALKEYAETIQRAFSSLSFEIDHIASCDDTMYCQWNVDEAHFTQRTNSLAPDADRKVMAVQFTYDRILKTWQPPDPWLPLWSDLHVP